VGIEVCVECVESAVAAEESGAVRVELCSSLFDGGLTPSVGMITQTRKSVKIPVYVMIRPRGGDFCYTDHEFEIMKVDIDYAKRSGADGVVLGILTEEGDIDVKRTSELVALARPLFVTFHRAFDMTRDPNKSLHELIGLGIERVLTSGQERSVVEGIDLISDLVDKAGSKIIIMPGGGVTNRNIKKIVEKTGVKEIHVSGRYYQIFLLP